MRAIRQRSTTCLLLLLGVVVAVPEPGHAQSKTECHELAERLAREASAGRGAIRGAARGAARVVGVG